MHMVRVNMDDAVFDKFMQLVKLLPKDKCEVVSDEWYANVSFENSGEGIVSEEAGIAGLLKEEGLTHFKYYEEDSRIVYTHDTGTPQQQHDFSRLKALLKRNNIKFESIGLDVLMIEKD